MRLTVLSCCIAVLLAALATIIELFSFWPKTFPDGVHGAFFVMKPDEPSFLLLAVGTGSVAVLTAWTALGTGALELRWIGLVAVVALIGLLFSFVYNVVAPWPAVGALLFWEVSCIYVILQVVNASSSCQRIRRWHRLQFDLRTLFVTVALIGLLLAVLPGIDIFVANSPGYPVERQFNLWKLLEGFACASVGVATLFALHERSNGMCWRFPCVLVLAGSIGCMLAWAWATLEFLYPPFYRLDTRNFTKSDWYRFYVPYVGWMIAQSLVMASIILAARGRRPCSSICESP